MNEPTTPLGRLLEEATRHYNPQPNVDRFERMLTVHHRRRAGLIVWSAAASLALVSGAAFAFNQGGDKSRIAPAHSADESDSTTSETTINRPDTTKPDGGRDPIDKPTSTEGDDTSTSEKAHHEPKPTQPKSTEPKTTEPDEETTTTEGEEPTWSAYQLHGSSEADPPKEVFWGTANPGDKIKIESDYGSVMVFANEHGDWEAHITFEGAPVGVAFQVWVLGPGHEVAFSFAYLG